MKIHRYYNTSLDTVKSIYNKNYNISNFKILYGQFLDNNKFEYREDIVSVLTIKQYRKLKYNKILA